MLARVTALRESPPPSRGRLRTEHRRFQLPPGGGLLRRLFPIPFILLVVPPLSACGRNAQAPKAPVQRVQTSGLEFGSGQQRAIANAHAETGGNLEIDASVLVLCPNVDPLPHGDSSRTKRGFEQALLAIAKCVQTDAMSGKSLLLVGHAERRGDPDYKTALGGSRADSVRYALTRLGVPEDQIQVASSDYMEAAEPDPDASKQDRRVDIKLAGK